jgi:putative phage-type endonuclease
MKIINTEQGSKEWLEYRKSKIMATDVPVILGSNPWKTKFELWEEKLGFRPAPQLNDAMRRGQLLEPEARKLACELIGIQFEPCVCESLEYPWLAVSLDGLSKCGKYILEIKCPKESTHLEAIQNCYPSYYYDQIQSQLLVTGADTCYYFSYRPEWKEKPYAIINIYSDLEKRLEILRKGKEFYNQMCTMSSPE